MGHPLYELIFYFSIEIAIILLVISIEDLKMYANKYFKLGLWNIYIKFIILILKYYYMLLVLIIFSFLFIYLI